MKYMCEINAKREMAGPGMWSFIAEAKVTGPDTAEEVYVSVSEYDGMDNLIVSKDSVMAKMAEMTAGGEEDDAEWADLMDKMARWRNGEDVDFGVAKEDDDYIEHYEKMTAAKTSAYYPAFKALKSVLDAMGKEVG